jgi:NifU-like protein involved in Fe-S cluster formation
MSPGNARYSPRVRALFSALDGAGDPAAGAGVLVSGEACALDRGAWVRFAARVDGGRFVDFRFRAFGCPHTLAAASWVACRQRGAPLDSPSELKAAVLARELDVPAEKLGRLLVLEDALQALLADLRRVQ